MPRSPRSRLGRTLLLLALSGPAFGACGHPVETAGSPAAPAASPQLEACFLISPADAQALLGGSVALPTTNEPGTAGSGVSQCAYRAPGSGAYLSLLTRLSPTPAAAAAAYERARAEAKALMGAEPREVTGVGEKAYWTGGTFRQLNVLQGKVWLIVAADLGPGRDRLLDTEAVARKALAKM
jgi:hypothetical protein